MPASLRSDGVQGHPGMPFGIIPDSAFGFAGIPTDSLISRSSVCQALLPLPGSPSVHRLKRPVVGVIDGDFSTVLASAEPQRLLEYPSRPSNVVLNSQRPDAHRSAVRSGWKALHQYKHAVHHGRRTIQPSDEVVPTQCHGPGTAV